MEASGAGSLRSALAEARAFLSMPALPVTDLSDGYDRTKAARRLWRRCCSIYGTHARPYLRARGILHCRFPALRFHPSLFYRDRSALRRFPALVAAVTDGDDGTICGVHRTWLDPQRPAKAPVARPRKALGLVHGHAVRFGQSCAGTLLVGEEIETVLSLVTALPDTVAAAALSAESLGAFVPSPGISRLVIASDSDPEGKVAAARLGCRCRKLRIPATVHVSEGNDFNDDLVALGPGTLTARIAPLFATVEALASTEESAWRRERRTPS